MSQKPYRRGWSYGLISWFLYWFKFKICPMLNWIILRYQIGKKYFGEQPKFEFINWFDREKAVDGSFEHEKFDVSPLAARQVRYSLSHLRCILKVIISAFWNILRLEILFHQTISLCISSSVYEQMKSFLDFHTSRSSQSCMHAFQKAMNVANLSFHLFGLPTKWL